MKILIYGAGVIGCTYGWLLSEAGYDITLMVKPAKREQYEKQGVSILCSDYRTEERQIRETTFFPNIIDKLDKDNDFDYIIVAVGSNYLPEILPVLSQSAGKAHILFFQNMWFNDVEAIGKYLSPAQYFFGFPFMAGGGKEGDTINTVISGSKYSKTMLGEADGSLSARVRKIAEAMQKAAMKPFVSDQIINWLIPHCGFIAAISASGIRAGGISKLLKDKNLLKESVKAIRESFHICEKKGIDPKKEKVNQLYYLPSFICMHIMRKIFGNEDMSMMFDGYISQSAQEVKIMLESIIGDGRMQSIATPYLDELYKAIGG